jgi:AraC-like DNA-binding protein
MELSPTRLEGRAESVRKRTAQIDGQSRLDFRDSQPESCYCAPISGSLAPIEPEMANRSQTGEHAGGLVNPSQATSFHSIPSAAGGISRLVYARMRELGVQLEPLLMRAQLTVEQIDNRGVRLDVRSQIKFLELCAAASKDDFLGFHLALAFDLREIGLLYYVLASSDVLGDALKKAERYSGIVNEGISLLFNDRRDTAVSFNYVDVDRRSDRHQIEFWLITLVRLCRQLTNRRLVPMQIKLRHHRAKTPAEFRSFLGCEIEFGTSTDEVVFTEGVKRLTVGSADPYLNELLVKYCGEAVAHRQPRRPTLRVAVEAIVARLLPHGKLRASEVARQLGMSHRTLVRRLSSDGLTYSTILDELKVDLAKRSLKDGNLPISQIAWLLGYSEISAFTHAFRRWTGITPRQWRARSTEAAVGNRADRVSLKAKAHSRR